MVKAVFFVLLSLTTQQGGSSLEPIRLSPDGKGFVGKTSGEPFKPWGFNYLGTYGTVFEEYWTDDWEDIVEDFREMKKLGANVVRIHLQLGTYMESPTNVKPAELARLRKLLDVARDTGLYLDVTGLGCYHLDHMPRWLDPLPEEERWDVQARFWTAISETCVGHPAVFCYDLMNEPIIKAKVEGEKNPWLTPEGLDGFYFVQRIANEPDGREWVDIAGAWVEKMTQAIRVKDSDTLITVGVIPWAQVFPGAKPLFYAPKVAKHLDFVSVHFYPKAKEVDKALAALKVYDIGKPIVIEETFPLACSIEELDEFIDGAGETVVGWISHHFGKKARDIGKGTEYDKRLQAATLRKFFSYWQEKGEKWKASSKQ